MWLNDKCFGFQNNFKDLDLFYKIFWIPKIKIKVADLNFGRARFCALPSFGAVTIFSSHTTFFSHKVSVKGSDIDMCSAIYFLFDHRTKYCTIYLCPHTVVATV